MREKIDNNPVLSIIVKVLKIVSWIILIALLILAGFLIYYVMMAKKAEKVGVQYNPPMALYTIISPSMVPSIKVYDVVFNLAVKDPKTLQKGDVITFVSSDSNMKGMIITHRIIDKFETSEGVEFKTKGDANKTADAALVYQDNVIGKVRFIIPQLGRVQFFLSDSKGWLIAILIPALLIISYDILKLIKLIGLKKELEKEENSLPEAVEDAFVVNMNDQSHENSNLTTPVIEEAVAPAEPSVSITTPVIEEAAAPAEPSISITTPVIEEAVAPAEPSISITTPVIEEAVTPAEPSISITTPVIEEAVAPAEPSVSITTPVIEEAVAPAESNDKNNMSEEDKKALLEKLLNANKK